MDISTTTHKATLLYKEEQALLFLKNAGFNSLDASLYLYDEKSELWQTDNWQIYAQNMCEYMQKAKISFCQTHAPFPSNITDSFINAITKAIKISGKIGSPYIVVHPVIPLELCYEDEKAKIWDINIKFFKILAPIAKANNIKIAIENMFRFDTQKKQYIPTMCSSITQLAQLIDALGDGFCACLDTGHANLYGDDFCDIISELGDRLQVTHIHDNNGIEDEHNLPNLGTINWDKIMSALSQINYKGALCFETVGFEDAFNEGLYAPALNLVYQTGLDLAKKYCVKKEC